MCHRIRSPGSDNMPDFKSEWMCCSRYRSEWSFSKNGDETDAIKALNRNDANLVSACESFTNGYGFDSVIITAAAPSNDPVELSAAILKKKGKVIVVGAVKMDIPRDPHFYRKELDLKMSCSYGPAGMMLIMKKAVWLSIFLREMDGTTEYGSFSGAFIPESYWCQAINYPCFRYYWAEKAYNIVLGKTKEPHIGILLRYKASDTKRYFN